ncbi:type II and III secretion system protein family protein [Pseudomonas sp. JZ134]
MVRVFEDYRQAGCVPRPTLRQWLIIGFGCLLLSGGWLAPGRAVAQPVEGVSSEGRVLYLASGEGQIVKFKAPVESVFVADPAIADLRVVSPGVVYVYGKTSGETNLIALSASEDIQGTWQLKVQPNVGPIKEAVQALQPGSSVSVAQSGKRLIAKGATQDVASALDMNALLDSQTPAGGPPPLNTTTYPESPQVNIRVRFAEVSREQLLRYGVNWNALITRGSFSFGLVTGGPLAQSAVAGATNLISAGYSSGSANIDVLLDALQSNGILEILAEPNITAVTGQTASFLAGGEVPVPVPVSRDLVGIEYKPFGVSLLFTPTLLPSGRIAMQVRPEVSSLSTTSAVQIAGTSVPTFQVRRADTRVEVGSGQTFAIAGLFQRNSAQDMDKLPMLGDVPILGALFQSKRFQRNETELVILITPYLVEPESDHTLATPLDPSASNPTQHLARTSTTPTKPYSEFGFYVD